MNKLVDWVRNIGFHRRPQLNLPNPDREIDEVLSQLLVSRSMDRLDDRVSPTDFSPLLDYDDWAGRNAEEDERQTRVDMRLKLESSPAPHLPGLTPTVDEALETQSFEMRKAIADRQREALFPAPAPVTQREVAQRLELEQQERENWGDRW